MFYQDDINECESNPCVNGAVCKNDLNKFTCECKEGFEGDKCEKIKPKCVDSVKADCEKNGGKCYDLVNDYFCKYVHKSLLDRASKGAVV